MRIGKLATEANVNIQTLRYYERRGLLPGPERLASGYRVYGPEAVQRVRFVRRAQELGFTLHEIADLLALWSDSAKSCHAVEGRARAALERIDGKIRDLQRMRRGLGQYVTACEQRSALDECPLLRVLGGQEMELHDRHVAR
ncbi:MAG: MerR family DNA-binding protein [Gemmatimonadaceae bacterium]